MEASQEYPLWPQADAEPVQAQPASYPSNEELQAAHDQREKEREQLRREHSERTGGGEVREGELQAQRDEHNSRTAGLHDGVDGSQDQDQA